MRKTYEFKEEEINEMREMLKEIQNVLAENLYVFKCEKMSDYSKSLLRTVLFKEFKDMTIEEKRGRIILGLKRD